VDNAPPPEIQDVQAHLVGGIPKREVSLYSAQLTKYGLDEAVMFVERTSPPTDYYDFKPEVREKNCIRPIIEEHPAVQSVHTDMQACLAEWWAEAELAIGELPGKNNLSVFRREFQNRLREELLSAGILDEFQIAGIFVNWWETVRFDLKTIVATGWSSSLISDEILLQAFFTSEQAALVEMESHLAEQEAEQEEALGELEIEPELDEDGKKKPLTTTFALARLKEELDGLKGVDEAEVKRLGGLMEVIRGMEKANKETKLALNKKKAELFGKVNKDGEVTTPGLIHARRAALTEDESKRLILQKLFKLLAEELEHYLKMHCNQLVSIIENMWDKYILSLHDLNRVRVDNSAKMNIYLTQLGYDN